MEISKILKYDPFNLKFEVLITLVILIGYISINRIKGVMDSGWIILQ